MRFLVTIIALISSDANYAWYAIIVATWFLAEYFYGRNDLKKGHNTKIH